MKIVVSLFDHNTAAEAAIQALLDNGFNDQQIGVLSRRTQEEKDKSDELLTVTQWDARLLEEVVAGGVGGILLGTLALSMPGVGIVFAEGALAALYTGAGAEGIGGLFWDAASMLGISRLRAPYYAKSLQSGKVTVTVHTEEVAMAQRVMCLLHKHHALELYQCEDSARITPGGRPAHR